MRSFLAMMRKEFLHIARDPQLVGLVIGLPILLLVLFGYALRLRPDNLTIAVWDQERSFFSVTVKDRLAGEGKLRVVEVDSEATIRSWLQTGKARLGLVIPAGFSQRLADGQQTPFHLLVDGSMPTLAQAGLFGARGPTDEKASEDLPLGPPPNPPPPTREPPSKIAEQIPLHDALPDAAFFLPGATRDGEMCGKL